MNKEITLVELAERLNGRIVGKFDSQMAITGTCAMGNYVGKKVSFVKNIQYAEMLAHLENAIILIPEDLIHFCDQFPQNVYIVVKDVLRSIADVQDLFYEDPFETLGIVISSTAMISNDAEIGKDVFIGENVYIGKNVVIGDGTKVLHGASLLDSVVVGSGTRIYPQVSLYRDSQVGNGCIIHSGARIGVDGFRFEQDIEKGLVRKWNHMGRVVIRDRVEIGANSTIARATFSDDATTLCDDVKTDSQVHVGHNVKIGARTLVAAQSCISGSCIIGEDVWVGAGVTIANGVRIGNRAKILVNAVVAYDVADDSIVSGFYAMPHKRWKHIWKKLRDKF